ncbi:MAG: M23 family metallopeptidase [Nitrospinales bacterium]
MEIYLPGKKRNLRNKRRFLKKGSFLALFVFSLALNGYFVFFQKGLEETPVSVAAGSPEPPALEERTATAAPVSGGVPGEAVPLPKAGTFEVKNASFTLPEALEGGNVHTLRFKIRNSLNRTFCDTLTQADGCEILSAYVARLLIWFIDINKQIRNGDEVSLVYEELEAEERYRILKLVFKSGYLGETFEANYYKYPGPRYGSYFDATGKSIVPRIVDKETPVRNYVEITSLPGEYRKGRFRGHTGTDFKTPMGAPVYSSFDGRVIRKNWNVRLNGYSLEIDHPRAGVKTRYLHLSKVLVDVGSFVAQSQKIAESGNTGRSFAPHLHYEILSRNSNKVIYNPFQTKTHKIYYPRVPSQRKGEFLKTVERYDSTLGKG